MGEDGKSGRLGQHTSSSQRRSVAQEGQRSRQGSSHFHRHRGSLDQIGLARMGLWLEAAFLALTVAGMWIPLSARLTSADVADNQTAPSLIEELPEEARFVLGDTHYDALRTYARNASKHGGFWSPPSEDPTRTPIREWRSEGYFISCVAWRTKISTSSSRASSMCISRFPQRGASALRASLLGRCSSTSWLCSTATSGSWRSVAASNHSSELLDEL